MNVHTCSQFICWVLTYNKPFSRVLVITCLIFVLDLPAVKELKSIITAALTEQVNQVRFGIYLNTDLPDTRYGIKIIPSG